MLAQIICFPLHALPFSPRPLLNPLSSSLNIEGATWPRCSSQSTGFWGREWELKKEKTFRQHYNMTPARLKWVYFFPVCFYTILSTFKEWGQFLVENKQGNKQRSCGHCIPGLIKMIEIQGVHSSTVFFLSLLPCLSPMSDVFANFLEAAPRALHTRFPVPLRMPTALSVHSHPGCWLVYLSQG